MSLLLCLNGINKTANAQTDSSALTVLVYADLYTSINPDAHTSHTSPDYIYSYHRVNELALNLALVDVQWKANPRTKLNLGFMTGTYPQRNMDKEPVMFRFLYEANVAYTLLPKHNVSLQMGLFPSHIGMESAIGIQNHALSRSLQADNSPYFETGIKLTKTFLKNKGEFSVLALNGWQQIQRESGQQLPSWGHQLLYHINPHWTFNSSSFIGFSGADSLGKLRVFHNLWSQYQLKDNWLIAGGFDLGNERKGIQQYGGFWWSTLQVLTRYKMNDRWAFCARWERANDYHQILFTFKDKEAHRVNGYSMNVDCKVNSTLHWRSELRCLTEENARPMFMGTMSLICQIQKQSL